MKRATLAAYLQISEPMIAREVALGNLPRPFKLAGHDHWHKDAVDKALADLANGGNVAPWRERHMEGRSAA